MEGRRKSLRVADKASFWRQPTRGAETSKPTSFCGMCFNNTDDTNLRELGLQSEIHYGSSL